MCCLRVISVVAVLLGSATSVAGQEPVVASVASTLTPGTRVRVLSTSVQARIRGVVVVVDDTVLTLAPESGLPLKLPLDSIRRMDVSLGQRRNTLKGLAIGTLSGIALGFAFPVDSETCHSRESTSFCSRGEAIGGGTLLFGGLGTLIGALIKTDRWAPISIGVGPAATTTGGRALEMTLALQF